MDESIIGTDTAETCWLCDRETYQLCHVHDGSAAERDEPVEIVWTKEPQR